MGAMLQTLPLILIFVVGFIVKRVGFMSAQDGATLLKLVFYIGAPAIIFTSVLKVQLEPVLLLWALLAVPIIAGTTLGIAYGLRRTVLAHLQPKTFASFAITGGIINTGMLVPFVQQIYGTEGLARLLLTDVAVSLCTYGLMYAVAVRFGGDVFDKRLVINKLLLSPPLWAVCLALLCKAAGLVPPVLLVDTLETVATCVGPVILIALGLKFALHLSHIRLLGLALAIRVGVGGLIGIGLIQAFDLSGLTASIALLISVAPIGYNAITFAELEKLDTTFASAQVSVSILLAMVYIPLVAFVAGS